jgi:hypothetical protein
VDNARIHPEALGNEQECLFCLEGWVFLGSMITTAKRSSRR